VLGRHDVGHRVVVRRAAGVRAGHPVFSDVLGELVELTETHLTVRAADGLVRVPAAQVVRAKRVPDRRRLTATESLEVAAAAGWPAPELARLGDWLLRAGDGWTGRANSALPVGNPDRPLPEAVDAVQAWYDERGIRPAISVSEPVGRRVRTELAARGWTPRPTVLVQAAALPDVVAATPAGAEVALAPDPSPRWLAVVARRKGGLPAAALHVLTAVPEVRFAGLYADSGHPLAVGRGVVAGAAPGWLGLSLIEVDPAVRRRGLARAVVGALARWGGELGAARAYLQVEERNTAAVALYARLGFATHHGYAVWQAPRDGEG
jgi:N-acetylglutamate synthase